MGKKKSNKERNSARNARKAAAKKAASLQQEPAQALPTAAANDDNGEGVEYVVEDLKVGEEFAAAKFDRFTAVLPTAVSPGGGGNDASEGKASSGYEDGDEDVEVRIKKRTIPYRDEGNAPCNPSHATPVHVSRPRQEPRRQVPQADEGRTHDRRGAEAGERLCAGERDTRIHSVQCPSFAMSRRSSLLISGSFETKWTIRL